MAPHNHICFFVHVFCVFPNVAQAGKERAAYFFTQWQRWDLPQEEVWFCDWIPRLNHSHSPDRAGFINETNWNLRVIDRFRSCAWNLRAHSWRLAITSEFQDQIKKMQWDWWPAESTQPSKVIIDNALYTNKQRSTAQDLRLKGLHTFIHMIDVVTGM